jgi:hypothetical protein
MRPVVAPPKGFYRRSQANGTAMRYEVVEDRGEWSVRSGGHELARFAEQDHALQDVAERLRDADHDQPSSLSVRYSPRPS